MPNNGQHRIVVGVDGSELSKRALRWAARQARLTGAVLEAVMAWETPFAYGLAPFAPVPASTLDADLSKERQWVLEATINDVLGVERDIDVAPKLIEGPAAGTLIRLAKDADLLVVGTHGHGGFTGMLLGSVSQHCVQHATCPVVVIRGDID